MKNPMKLCTAVSMCPHYYYTTLSLASLNNLLESTVDGGPDVGHVLPEINGGDGTLGDALGGKLELLF